jgi:hypothetical protein
MMISNNMLVVSRSRSEDVNAPLAGAPYLSSDANAKVYSRFTMVLSNDLPTLTGTYFAHFRGTNTGAATDFGARIFLTLSNTISHGAVPAGKYRISVANGAAATNNDTFGQIDVDLDTNVAYTVVTRFVPSTGLATIWLNPAAESDPSATATDPGTAIAPNPFNVFTYAFRQAAGEGTVYVDDLKVGTAFTDVAGANTSPTISSIPKQNIPANASTGPVAFTVGDAETAPGALNVTATSLNTTLVPNGSPNIVLGGSGASRTITVTPAAGLQGTTTITVNVSDGVNASFTTFDVNVGSPTVSALPNLIVQTNTAVPPVSFTVGDAESDPLTFTASSSNPSVLTDANILFSGTGNNRTATLTPQPGVQGLTTVTINVSDGHTTNSSSFTLTMRPELGLVFADDFSYVNFLVPNALYQAESSPWTTVSGTAYQLQVTNGFAYLNRTNTEDLGAPLTNGPFATSDAVVFYTKFNVNVSALPSPLGNYFIHLKSSAIDGQNFRARVFVNTTNAAAGSFRLGLANNSAGFAIQFPTDLSLNTTYTVVTRYNSATGESVLWVNPVSEASPSVAAPDLPSLTAIGGIALREDTGIGELTVASLKIGTSFSDVLTVTVPTAEPLKFGVAAGSLVLSWTNSAFSLASASVVTGPYNKIIGATSPYTNSLSGSEKYFRLVWP